MVLDSPAQLNVHPDPITAVGLIALSQKHYRNGQQVHSPLSAVVHRETYFLTIFDTTEAISTALAVAIAVIHRHGTGV